MMTKQTLKIAFLSSLIALGGVAVSAKTPEKGAMFAQIDADGDGAVTAQELSAHAAARFAAADADKDGFLTAQEMLMIRGGKRAEKMLERFDTDGNGQLSAAELDAAVQERGGKRAKRMMERLDANNDGKLALDEMTAHRDPAKMFERLDKDKNGSLSAEEFAKARGHGGHGKHGDKRHED
ncbi:MAG: EF-hand domain-containing protein [Sulfitobacter sp.]|nr:EF-hand domain-containing protein [Sulfitobacter sp.]